jgi:hypothetical protein
MRELPWRLAFAGLWIVLVAVGLWFLAPVFTYACDDCIGSRPGYFGEGGFKVDWQTVVTLSVLVASFVTGLVVVVSRALRRRPGSVVSGS